MLLEIKNLALEFHFDDKKIAVLRDLSLELAAGRSLGIVGESGCGKSVTALSILRLLATPPAVYPHGEIRFEGKDLLKLDAESMRNVRGNDISMIFQDPMTALNPVYTVGHQISESFLAHEKVTDKAVAYQKSAELLELVGIPEAKLRLASYPHELSGGMRQRVMIAMALACEPKLLIADEPTTALDVTIQAQILELLKKLKTTLNLSIMMISHDLGVVSDIADDVAVMYLGEVVEKASRDDFFARPMHPYTLGLMESVPGIQDQTPRSPLKAIPGSIPRVGKPIVGCPFAGRCFLVKDHCRTTHPPLEEKIPGHFVRCLEVPKHG